jgi:hypothetical protein
MHHRHPMSVFGLAALDFALLTIAFLFISFINARVPD